MSNKPLNISESASVQMPMKTVASLIILVGMGVFAYTELTSRLVSLETSREFRICLKMICLKNPSKSR